MMGEPTGGERRVKNGLPLAPRHLSLGTGGFPVRRGARNARPAVVLLLLAIAGAAGYLGGRYLWGRHHYRAALQALERRDFRQAGFHLDKCRSAWPADADVE